jgi:hypothetical protein
VSVYENICLRTAAPHAPPPPPPAVFHARMLDDLMIASYYNHGSDRIILQLLHRWHMGWVGVKAVGTLAHKAAEVQLAKQQQAAGVGAGAAADTAHAAPDQQQQPQQEQQEQPQQQQGGGSLYQLKQLEGLQAAELTGQSTPVLLQVCLRVCVCICVCMCVYVCVCVLGGGG